MLENYLRCYCSMRQDDWDENLTAAEFAYNSARSDELQTTPFEIDTGWNPRTPLEPSREDSPVESVNEFKKRLKDSLDDGRFSHELAKAQNAAYASLRYVEPKYEVNDMVWLNRSIFRDSVSKAQKYDKLGENRFGHFRITELIAKNALRLDCPGNIRIHPCVHVAHTLEKFGLVVLCARPLYW